MSIGEELVSNGHMDKEGQSDKVSTIAESEGLLWIPFPLMATMCPGQGQSRFTAPVLV